jgi:hypothetical protein
LSQCEPSVTGLPSIKVIASCGHELMQVPQPVQRSAMYPFSGEARCDSGVEHHKQESGHPLRKTTVRKPWPS